MLDLIELAKRCPALTLPVKASDLTEAGRSFRNELPQELHDNLPDEIVPDNEILISHEETMEKFKISRSTLWPEWNRIKDKKPDSSPELSLGEELPGLRSKDTNKMKFDKIFFENSFSHARMKPYFDRYPGEESKAIRHYEQNIRLAESLAPSLSVFEVTLRNAVIRQLERKTGRKDWYEEFKSYPVTKDLYKYVTTAANHIKARGETVSPDKINGELTMGFWVSLSNAEYEMSLWKYLRLAFPNMPKSQRQRKIISAPLNTLRSLRNRVFHNENISWSMARLEELHNTALQVIHWMNPDVALWLTSVDRFRKVSFIAKCQLYGWITAVFRKG